MSHRAHNLRAAGAVLLAACLLAGPAQARTRNESSPVLPAPPLHPAGRWLEDATGRVVIIHGLELARKTPPYHAPVTSFTAQDAQNIENWGFDAVRLGWFWKGLEPQRGRIDRAYLDEIAREGSLLAEHHVFTLLEAHQDGYNEALGGAGFPDWATITDGTWGPVETVPGTGVFDLRAARAFDNLYLNTGGIADAFATAWAAVAERFRTNRMMLGYDLFNEPNPGSQWATCANPAGCPAFDLETMQPLENKLAAAVRSVDQRTIVFYEPNIYFDSGVPSWLAPPPRAMGPAGLAFHDYCLSAALTEQPDNESASSGYPACPPIDAALFANALRAAAVMGVPPLFGEFGDTQDLANVERIITLADRNLTGWMYWSYKDWVDDPGGLGSGSLFDDSDNNGTLRQAKLAVLSQPYPIATAGIPRTESYDPVSDTFTYAYTPDHRIAAPTVIFAAPLHYPHGYGTVVTGARVISPLNSTYLELRADPRANSVRVQLIPEPGASSGTTSLAFSPRLTMVSTPTASANNDAGGLGQATGHCNGNAGSPAPISSPALAASHGDVIALAQTHGGAGEITAPDGISVAYAAGDAAWMDLGAVPAGGVARASVICRSGAVSYSVSFGDAPTVPVSFSGSSTHDINVSLASSRLAFQTPAAGHYLADIEVARGKIEVALGRSDGTTSPANVLDRSGTEDLGTLLPGTAWLDVVALAGPEVQWTVTVREAATAAAGSPRSKR